LAGIGSTRFLAMSAVAPADCSQF